MTVRAFLEGALAGPKAGQDPYDDSTSIEFGFRAKRFEHIADLIRKVLAEQDICRVLDLGGTETYWRVGSDFIARNRDRIRFTIVNTDTQSIADPIAFQFVHDSAARPDLFYGERFDLVHSNSVIEHLGSWQAMVLFAQNVRRLGSRYYVQTPNFWFPYEPHFRAPGFQYMPSALRRRLVMHTSMGFFPRTPDPRAAQRIIDEHRLLSTRQMRTLFPDASVTHEKFLFANKSVIATRD